MSNKLQIEDSLKSLILNDDREFVAMLSGEWGIGKTYFWKELSTSKELIDSKKSITYISLFGYSSIQGIKNDIVLKLSKAETTKAVFSEVFQSFRTSLGSKDGDESSNLNLSGSLVSSALSLIPEKSLIDSIICFDDFERLSDKVSFKDIMGLISQFKEQKKCKIIMILNEGELSKNHQEIFSRYKEKIVDYSFNYLPSQEECSKAMTKDLEKITWCNHQVIYDFFKKIDLKNIRIMNQVLYQLNHFNFIENYGYSEKVVNEFVEIALNLFVFKAKSNYIYQEFNDMQSYTPYDKQKYLAKIYNDKEAKLVKNKKHERNLEYYYIATQQFEKEYHSTNKEIIEKNIYNFIDTNKRNENELQDLLKENNKNLSWYDTRDEITESYKKLCTDFSTKHNELIIQLHTLLKTHKDIMPRLFHYDKFKSFIKGLKEFSPEESITIFEKEIIENYIIFYTDNPTYDKKDYSGFYLNDIKSDYIWAEKFYDTHKKKSLTLKGDDEIIHLIRVMNENNHYESDVKAILTLVPPEKFKELIEKNNAFPEILVKFMLSSTARHYMKDTIKSICEALISLRNENKEYAWKVDQILKSAKINLEDYK